MIRWLICGSMSGSVWVGGRGGGAIHHGLVHGRDLA